MEANVKKKVNSLYLDNLIKNLQVKLNLKLVHLIHLMLIRIKCSVIPGQLVINYVSSGINGASLILEQQIIRDGFNELFTLSSLES
jgi:hypothetical protein